ncbi:MAG: hypothetical protein JW702_04955 [Clostridiales bacterium]|nr:hypothetical protein [Clostridiales bacterium]
METGFEGCGVGGVPLYLDLFTSFYSPNSSTSESSHHLINVTLLYYATAFEFITKTENLFEKVLENERQKKQAKRLA